MTPPLRLQRIEVLGLFGLYDHDIRLNLGDRVTILHGPNGVGKTQILRMTASALRGDYDDLRRVPFRTMRLHFTSDTVLTVTPQAEASPAAERRRAVPAQLDVRAEQSGEPLDVAALPNEELDVDLRIRALKAEQAHQQRLGRSSQVARLQTELQELFRLQTRLRSESARLAQGRRPPLRGLPKVHLIETQRLLVTRKPRLALGAAPDQGPSDAILDHAGDLADRLRKASADYGARSRELDATQLTRLFSGTFTPGPEAELVTRVQAIGDRISALQKLGILPDTSAAVLPASNGPWDDVQRRTVTLWADDMEAKLATLEPIAERCRLFERIVNGKLRNKALRIDPEEGFCVISADNRPLTLDALSSGEQHELVLIYRLLFRAPPGSLVLIDEPELSLHVSWQKAFIPDLLDVVQLVELDAVVATHSPQIVDDRIDLMVPLHDALAPTVQA